MQPNTETRQDGLVVMPTHGQQEVAPIPRPLLIAPPTPQELASLNDMAGALALSSYFQQDNEPERAKAQALAKILYGRELQIPPMAAMTSIHVITNKHGGVSLSLSAGMMLALAMRVGATYSVHHMEDGCRIAWFRHGKPVGETKFTSTDAIRAGLMRDGGNHQKYPEDMCFNRAASRGVRRYFPDATSGMSVYAEGEVPEEAEQPTDKADEPSSYANERHSLLQPSDFSDAEKPLVVEYVQHVMREDGSIKPDAKATRAQIMAFFAQWHPRTKADLLAAAADLFQVKDATSEPVDDDPEPTPPEPVKSEPKPQPEPVKAKVETKPTTTGPNPAKNRPSLFGPRGH